MFNVSGKISPHELEIYAAVARAASEVGVPFLVVGASARDLVLHYAHDAPIIRATGDIDIAVQVQSWKDFSALKNRLLEIGFQISDQVQRLRSPSGLPVDFVPFGGVEDEPGTIRWAPEGVIHMSVLGFREALENCDRVRVRDQPELDIPVATLAGLSILKILAWAERPIDQRRKDAIDLLYLLKNCERSHPFGDQVYERTAVLESYSWDTALATAQLLGAAARRIVSSGSFKLITALQAGEMAPLTIERLIEEMTRVGDVLERNQALTGAFFRGFNEQSG